MEQPGIDMSSLAASNERTLAAQATVIQPAWVRVAHWINAVAMILMIMSGWQIYNASPLFDFRFSHSITLGSWLGGSSDSQNCPQVGDCCVRGRDNPALA